MANKEATIMPISGESGNKKVLGRIKARVIDTSKALSDHSTAPGQSQKLPEDPWAKLTMSGEIIEPPFDMLTLAMLPENNTEMIPCLEAMETNIEGYGHRFISRIKPSATGKKVPKILEDKVRAEKVALENFFMYCTREPFPRFRKKLRRDLESTGCAYFEVVRDVKGGIQSFVHIPSYQMRLSKMEDDPYLLDRPIIELVTDGSVRISNVKEWRRCRRYIQCRSVQRRNLEIVAGYKMRWFKEFGDTRIYDNETGKVADGNLPVEKRANEVIYMSIYSSRTPYGLPRFIGNLFSIFGDRAAEEINFITFRNNNIPSMVVAVSNGQLTEGSIERITSFVDSQIQGSDNYSKFLILEAESAVEGEEGNQIKIDIKPLTEAQQRDALFQNYSSNNQDKIRRVWRLPPIFVGRSDDYTRATADSSRRLADEQVFAPERDDFDALMNRDIFPDMGILYHKYRSNTPNTTDNEGLIKILAGAEKTGGMTPRIARMMLEEILGDDLPPFPDDFNADMPFSLLMAEAVKNKADASEPGQQLTALKALQGVFGTQEDGTDGVYEAQCPSCGKANLVHGIEKSDDPLVDYLIRLNKRIEKRWQEALKENESESCTH